MTSACPSAEALAQLGQDSLTGASLAAIDDHVEGCVDCRAALEAIARGTPWPVGSGRERLPGPEQWPRIPGFLIEAELGRGGMGVVYRAWQAELGRRVAIKVVAS